MKPTVMPAVVTAVMPTTMTTGPMARMTTGTPTMLTLTMSAAADLLPLVERVSALSEPSRIHPRVHAIEAAVLDWTRKAGLTHDVDVGLHRMAAMAFADADTGAAALFGQWLTWVFLLDDELDEAGGQYPRLFDGHGEHPLESAFAELWRRTSAGMSDEWRLRFATNLQRQQDACRVQSGNRRRGRIPTLSEYPALRRGTVGPFLYDLVEPCLGVEVPAAVQTGWAWQTMVESVADVAAWCNDVASLPKERGDGHNLLVVAAADLRLGERETLAWALERIAERCEEMCAAARRLPLETLDQETARNVSKVASAYLGAPRAHLDWLLESARYA